MLGVAVFLEEWEGSGVVCQGPATDKSDLFS